jgi:AraC-like DNA-binding protein
MGFTERRPTDPALAPFIRSFWHFTGDFPHQRERMLPSGCFQLLVNLDRDELSSYHDAGYRRLERIGGAGLCGAYAHHFAIDTAEQRAIAGVSFHPGGAYPFFAAPADAVRELHVDLGDLWGRDGAVVRERLLAACTVDGILRALETIMHERVVRTLAVDPIVGYAMDALEGGAPVAAVVDRVGMTAGGFIRYFSARVGLTPKRYARVRRFRRVLEAIDGGRGVDWARVAASAGYFDQAHMIHDFRAFAGVSPTAYRPRAPGDVSHVVLDEAE